MNVTEASTQPALAEERASDTSALPEERTAEPSLPEASLSESGEPEPRAEPADGAEPANLSRNDRKKLQEQLEALKRKEFELRRALTLADHPELAEAIRVIEGRVFALTRIEGKLAQGLSKGEARRRETLDKKLTSLREKRAELSAQIETLEAELHALGADRSLVVATERSQALEQLLVALGSHDTALAAAGLDAVSLVPELARFLPEVEALAESMVAERKPA